jgi:hypothetical protein
MTRFYRTLSLALLFACSVSVHAFGLPDTGQTTCYNDSYADSLSASSASSVASDTGPYPRQDCRYGRDDAVQVGALIKTGGGAKGFDYSKIANNGTVIVDGTVLGNNPTDWACTKDNITGLTWEVKTTSGLHNIASTYSWYSSNAATNGGNTGTANGGICSSGTDCDTEKYLASVNAAMLCTYTDWRMPTIRELLTIVYADGSSPTIEPTYFPNTSYTQTSNPFAWVQLASFWSGSSRVANPSTVWVVNFNNGVTETSSKSGTQFVRLVRGRQF